ncbi:mitochondrial 54S ribosomal protein bL21m [Kwoniella pini CBS 10737]|uniref:Large ribosomal subunit protein bL21m n=1 Tax=Kwoniella pini CBS 10737 TaxID=1296096 RepID=A0A1B9HZC9_9TREE|nr:uncharacterized protein I206_05390 [Kwoniella pini CBS 10737]OCF48610.1 hypothetical protein I206_05390 [Kwoniella pini CBS 10737]
MSRPSITSAFARLSLSRGLQTTAPLPPPTTSLPPSSSEASSSSSTSETSTSSSISHLPPILPNSSNEIKKPKNTKEALKLISSQSTNSFGRYLITRLYSRNYLLHSKDILTLPQLKKPFLPIGTQLNLTKILEIGSRDFSLKSNSSFASNLKKSMNWKEKTLINFENLPLNLVNCKLTIIEHTKSPLERILKKKRRKGYKKTIEHKQGYTRLRVGDIIINDIEKDI